MERGRTTTGIPERLSLAEQRSVIDDLPVPSFTEHLAAAELPTLKASAPDILQINVGKLCNQSCSHCHVDAGPNQTEANMDWPTFEAVLAIIAELKPSLIDITGGAPELNPHFRRFVREARALGVEEIIDRCNLTVLLLKQQRDLAQFLADQRVQVVSSLPAVNEKQTDSQRGGGVFGRSIKALRLLNEHGYGMPDSGLELTLVSNPAGAFLPAPQEATERRFRELLRERYQIEFSKLIQITNMPISRFLEFLISRDLHERYVQRLSQAFNPAAVDGLMCHNTLSISWDGRIYDCDFNQMLDLPVEPAGARSIFDFRSDLLAGRPISVGKHCLGCTAGQGSSCGGATSS